ncbi:MAG: ATP-binding protein [Nitrosomonadaceae bacterium]|nr:ATP-binding protein [Nitrosomonadaceae bacterium]
MVNQEPSLVNFNPFTEAAAGRYFVGREDQLKQFRLHLNGLRGGNPSNLYIAGVHGTGKTSFLTKLVEIAKDEDFLAVIPRLDPNRPAHEHISTIMRSIIEGLQEHMEKKGTAQGVSILTDWDSGKKSTLFYHPRSEKLKNDYLRQDFETLQNLMQEANVLGALVCIDEGQRIDASALSALKNSLQHLNSYLIMLSLRLIVDTGGSIVAGRTLLDEKAREAEGDFGASRFFVTGIAVGPFDTDNEAVDCIKRRLEDNLIQFNDEVVGRIGRITGRIPRDIISLASNVYDNAAVKDVRFVTVALLNESFRNANRSEVREVENLCDKLSERARSALRGLLAIRRSANAEEIATYLHPTAQSEARAYIVDGIQNELKRVCKSSSLVIEIDDSYKIASPFRGYALELALRVEQP